MSQQRRYGQDVNTAGEAEVAEFMVTSLDGTRDAALMARPGSGIVFNMNASQHASIDPAALPHDLMDKLDEIYQPCIDAQKDFIATANKQRKKSKLPEFEQVIPRRWSDVSEAVASTCNELERMTEVMDKNVSGSIGRLKSGFQKLCKHIEKGETFVSLIPTDSFALGSTLRGGLAVIFSAMKSTGAHREEVYETLEELPFILTDHVANIKWFQGDEELHRRTAALFTSIFKLLKHILSWLLKGSFVTGLKTIADPKGLSSGLSKCRKEVKIGANRFRDHAANLAVAYNRRFGQFTYAMQERSISNLGELILGQGEDMRSSNSRMMSLLELNAMRGQALEALFPLLSSVHERLTTLNAGNAISILPEAPRGPTSTEPKETADQLVDEILEEYSYDAEMLEDDVQFFMTILSRPGRRVIDRDRLYAIQSSSDLRAWGLVDESSVLLIHGRVAPRPESAVSLASAQIVDQMLRRSSDVDNAGAEQLEAGRAPPAVVPLAYFCGRHHERSTDTSITTRLILSLILQLLDRARQILDIEAVDCCVQDMEAAGKDVEELCFVFRDLVNSLPGNVFVVMVVDGISFFERWAREREDMRVVVASLLDLHRQQQTEATLKFLFTSPLRPAFVEDLFEADEVLNMPRNISLRRLNSDPDWELPLAGSHGSESDVENSE